MTWFAPLARRESVSAIRDSCLSALGQFDWGGRAQPYSKWLTGHHLRSGTLWHSLCLHTEHMKQSFFVLGLIAALALPSIGQAQDRGAGRVKGGDQSIPASARPPAGMCRVWLADVPVAQQPAPTDCSTAVRNRSPKSRVIFGDDYVDAKKDTTKSEKTPAIKGFAPSKSATRKPPFSIKVP
jgi:hypothetical protein